MHEALFRGKRLDNGEWVYGDLEHNAQGEEYIRCWYCGAYQAYKIDPATRGEYTGLTDKNGMKIFEGDIIHVVIPNSNGNFEVKFKYGQFYIGINMSIAYVRNSCEVICNIHDNPELLKAGSEK